MRRRTVASSDRSWRSVFASMLSARRPPSGKIEEGRIIRGFFKRSGQPLMQPWLVEMAKRLARHLPIRMGFLMGIAALFRPRTSGWGKAKAALEDYIAGQEGAHRRALGLDRNVELAQSQAHAAPGANG